MPRRMSRAQQKAMFAKIKNPYILKRSFRPKKFEKGVYAVSYARKGLPLVDKNTRLYQVKAQNKKQAERRAEMKLLQDVTRTEEYRKRVEALEKEGLTTSDAQAEAEAEILRRRVRR